MPITRLSLLVLEKDVVYLTPDLDKQNFYVWVGYERARKQEIRFLGSVKLHNQAMKGYQVTPLVPIPVLSLNSNHSAQLFAVNEPLTEKNDCISYVNILVPTENKRIPQICTEYYFRHRKWSLLDFEYPSRWIHYVRIMLCKVILYQVENFIGWRYLFQVFPMCHVTLFLKNNSRQPLQNVEF